MYIKLTHSLTYMRSATQTQTQTQAQRDKSIAVDK